MLAKRKLDSIEKFISKALNDMEISHAEFVTDRYDKQINR